jgi:hypothetical protein
VGSIKPLRAQGVHVKSYATGQIRFFRRGGCINFTRGSFDWKLNVLVLNFKSQNYSDGNSPSPCPLFPKCISIEKILLKKILIPIKIYLKIMNFIVCFHISFQIIK